MSENTITVEPINIKSVVEFENQARDLTADVPQITINTQEQYEQVAGRRKSLKEMEKAIEDQRKKLTTPIDAAKKAVQDLFNPIKTRLDNSIRHIDSLLVDYTDKKERERRELEEKLAREAEAEEKKKKAALEARADKALASGNQEKSEELKEKAGEVFVPRPTIASQVQKVDGLSFREDWSAQVLDLKAMVDAISAGKAPITFIMPNQTVLNQQARATKGSLQFPGVKFTAKKIPMGR